MTNINGDHITRTSMFSVGPLAGAIPELLQKHNQGFPYDRLHSFRKDIADMDTSVLTRYVSTATFEQGDNMMESPFLWPLCLLKDATGENRNWET